MNPGRTCLLQTRVIWNGHSKTAVFRLPRQPCRSRPRASIMGEMQSRIETARECKETADRTEASKPESARLFRAAAATLREADALLSWNRPRQGIM